MENGKLVYLYELVDGAAESSHAAAIAQLLEINGDCLVHGAQVCIPNPCVVFYVVYNYVMLRHVRVNSLLCAWRNLFFVGAHQRHCIPGIPSKRNIFPSQDYLYFI